MFWYRWIQTEPTRIGPTTINPRQAFALSSDGKDLYVHLEDGTKHFCRDIDGMRLLQFSRPMLNKDTIKDATIQDIKDRSVEKKENSASSIDPQNAPGNPIPMWTGQIRLKDDTPRIPKAFPLKIEVLDSKRTIRFGRGVSVLDPVGSDILPMINKSLQYLGNRTNSTARRFVLCESDRLSTCFIMQGQSDGSAHNYIVLDRFQLAQLNHGILDTSLLARVITHEYAHYLWHSGGVKQTHKERFRQLLAGKRAHPNQFEHPGYSYPWYEEAWAVLAEYMVHGKSARRLSMTVGWEIVAEYFDNNFIKAGTPSGESLDTRYL